MSATIERSADATAVRPFEVEIADAEIEDLRSRIAATRLPEKEPVADASQGVQLAVIEALVKYWGTEYDFGRIQARLNALPQFMTEIDGLDIHFIHVRSPHEDALPVILTHGWPGSVVEMLNVIGPLTDPTAHGGSAEDAFHVVVPSIPGYGFSGKPTETGWGPERIARANIELMKRLGYTRFVAQGGDWGAIITDLMGVQAPPELIGIHTNMPGAVPPEISGDARAAAGRTPAGLSRPTRRGLRGADRRLHEGHRLRDRDAAASADALRNLRFAGRAGRLDARPRRAQLRRHHARVRRRATGGQPHPGRGPRQRDPDLVHEHGDLLGSPLRARTCWASSTSRASRSRSR